MSQGRGLFGLKVNPGEIVPLDIFTDVRITNIAFGEEITGKGRSVVKVHRARVLDEFDDLSDYDEEDSDEEDEDEDEEDEAAADAKVNGKAEAAAEINGKVDEEDDSQDGEDTDDEGEDEDEDEDDFIEEEFVICSLYPEKVEQAIVDLEFSEFEDIAFSVTGENAVELIGYYVESDPYDEDPDSDELDSDDEYDSDELAMFNEIEGGGDSDEDMEEGEARIQEILERAAEKAADKAASSAKNNKKRAKAEDSDEEIEAVKESVEDLTKNQKKKLNKKLKTEVQQERAEEKKPKEKAAKEDKSKAQPVKEKAKEAKEDGSKKVKTASGLIIEDKTVGTGPQAKAGQRIGMRYVGRLTNGKQFDANQKGKPFSFKLGKGEVIAGWDEGVKGMQVGGTRRLTIPPQLAYGKKGAPPDIPPNSTLVFDVKLVEIK